MSHNTLNQVAVVTGAGGGFGLETVKQLLEKGFYVAATDVSEDTLNRLDKNGIQSDKLKKFVMDVSDKKMVATVAEKIANAFEAPISILINNAGIFETNFLLSLESNEILEKTLKINLLGPFYCASVFGRIMMKNKFGRIVNIASIAGSVGLGGGSAYSATKAGLIGATKSWARELAPMGITVNSVAPGFCKTDMLDKQMAATPQAEEMILSYVPVKRFGTPADIAEIVCFLASSKTNYINGETIIADGGMYTGSIKWP